MSTTNPFFKGLRYDPETLTVYRTVEEPGRKVQTPILTLNRWFYHENAFREMYPDFSEKDLAEAGIGFINEIGKFIVAKLQEELSQKS